MSFKNSKNATEFATFTEFLKICTFFDFVNLKPLEKTDQIIYGFESNESNIMNRPICGSCLININSKWDFGYIQRDTMIINQQ